MAGLKNSGGNKNYVNFSSKPDPAFNLVNKQDGEWKVTGTYNTFEGKLVGASIGEYEYKGETKNKLNLEFEVNGDTYSISFNMNGVAKSVINTLSNDNYFGKNLKLSVYKKNDFANIFISCDDEKIGWKFGPEQVSKIFNQDHRWIDMFNKYIQQNADNYVASNKVEDPMENVLEKNVTGSDIIEDDLPF